MNEQENKAETKKQRIMRKVRKQRLKYIAILPSLITLVNGVCGFAAIVFAGKIGQVRLIGAGNFDHFSAACYMIFVAMLADMLDGRVARLSHSTSSFGGQLDSLCDIISFGLAPAVLMLKFMENKINLNPAMDVFVYRFLWLSAAVYFSCAAIRLARFNVENEEDESHHNSFFGLPTPAAAGVIASLVILNQYLVENPNNTITMLNTAVHYVIVAVLPFATIAIALLMVSRLNYTHLFNRYLRGKKPFASLLWVGLMLFLIIFCFEIASAIIFCSFAASGFVQWVHSRIHSAKPSEDLPMTAVSR